MDQLKMSRDTYRRFMAKVTLGHEGGCWGWAAAKNPQGYGYISIGLKLQRVHRVTYRHYVGEIPEGLELDHLCGNRWCCNPKHLEAVTHGENIRRGRGSKKKTHCKRGHEFTEENTYQHMGTRRCRACRAEYQRVWKAERAERCAA